MQHHANGFDSRQHGPGHRIGRTTMHVVPHATRPAFRVPAGSLHPPAHTWAASSTASAPTVTRAREAHVRANLDRFWTLRSQRGGTGEVLCSQPLRSKPPLKAPPAAPIDAGWQWAQCDIKRASPYRWWRHRSQGDKSSGLNRRIARPDGPSSSLPRCSQPPQHHTRSGSTRRPRLAPQRNGEVVASPSA